MPNIFSFLNTIMLSRALYVAADLHIADHLKGAPLDADTLAKKTDTCPQTLKRLLYFLELHEVFSKDDAGNYHLNAFSNTMCTDDQNSIRPFLLHEDSTRWNALGNLGYSIETGKSSFQMLHGKDYFAYIKDQPMLSERFDQAMKVISQKEDTEIANALPFEGIVADIGGGIGQLLNSIHHNYPSTKGVLFELPEVIINLGPTQFERMSGSFFEPLSIKADIYILKRILHDWDDQKAIAILKNVSNAMRPKSKLYIIDGLLDQAENKQLLAAIDLALLTIFQGKERTLDEMQNLLDQAQLEIVSITPINELMSALECKKVAS